MIQRVKIPNLPDSGKDIAKSKGVLGNWESEGRKGFALRVHAKSKAKMKARVRELTNRRMVNDYEKWKADLKQCVVGWPTN